MNSTTLNLYCPKRQITIREGSVLRDKEDPTVLWKVREMNSKTLSAHSYQLGDQEFPMNLLTWYFAI